MIKNVGGSKMSNVENNQQVTQVEEKTLVFSPGGFILKLIFSIGLPIFMLSSTDIEVSLKNIAGMVFGFVVLFVVFYFVATVFGFAVNVTGNYIIGGVVFLILLGIFFAILTKVESALAGLGGVGEALLGVIVVALMIWPLIKDIKKAILYFKSTV